MSKSNIAIIYGGKSVEHEISIRSAGNVFKHINRDKYEPVLFGISPQGKWYLTSEIADRIEEGEELSLDLSGSFSFKTPSGKIINPDIFFPVLHGPNGEDGSVQGLLQTIGKPFVGTGVCGSSMSMSKLVAKQLMKQHGIPTARFLHYYSHNKGEIKFRDIVDKIGLPFMVKPATLGSSIGICKVTEDKDLSGALEEAFTYDTTVLLEEYIEGRELECAVMGNEVPEVSQPGEIVVNAEYDFYTYQAKYFDENAVKIDVPAVLDKSVSGKIREICKKCYLALECEDFARIDLFLTKNNEILINEVNTIPGFTDSSMFPMMWAHEGLSFTELIDKLISYSLERHKKLRNIKSIL